MCGVCKIDKSRPQEANAQQSKEIVQQNKMPGVHCTITERLASYVGGIFHESQCKELQKHKVRNDQAS